MKTLCKIFSYLLHPYLVPLYIVATMLFGATNYTMLPVRLKLYLMWVFTLYALILPLITTVAVRRFGHKKLKAWFHGRRRRILPLMVGAICYTLCAITLLKAPSLMIFRKLAIAGMLCELFCLFVLPMWRVSLHLTAMGAAVALLIVLNVAGALSLFWAMLIAIMLTGFLASARLYIGRNNGLQILVGFAGGFAIGVISYLYL
ncbi:MAG: hypothetical protein IKY82_07410 [Alistipes sp.]|nr:hypothetical protein [Alistipes sp.]